MSLSDLEHAATVPSKWASLSSKPRKSEEPLSSATTRRLHCPRSLTYDIDEELGEFTSFCLVPGGRYLVTFARNWVAVWDLGLKPGPDTITDFQPLGVSAVHFTGMFLVHPTIDGKGLHIFVSAAEQTMFKQDCYESSVLLIYEIYPQNVNPKLELIARLNHVNTDEINFFSLSRNRLIFMEGSILKIWHYTKNSWAHWTVEKDYYQIIVGESTVTLLSPTGVSVWPIPALSSSSPPFLNQPPQAISPLVTLPYPNPRPSNTDWCEGPCDWYSGTTQPFLYDLVNWDSDSETITMRRYEVSLAQDLKSSELIERQAFTFHGPDEPDILFQPSAFNDNSLVTIFFDFTCDSIKLHTGSFSGPSSPNKDGKLPDPEASETITLVKGEHITKGYAMAFCPISARFLYLDSEKNICIIDYISQPASEVSWLDIQRGSRDYLVDDAVLELVETC
ncbi:hypothetical protein JR316_0008665 [Psilocybe cubensis]|uniref:Uncharacterized protein n=1 Tax=Psilocybe cubensis TaxID=181762 RepID=A0ACB8GS82_PSICU|nr:hypothetical protein JR316_0008665 [Psilocybe cubensis]KAH9478212.1 hypothetical protein JR316_0008665 [Psilocybe cubensis]